MTGARDQYRVPGRDILAEVRDAYLPYRPIIADRDPGVLIIRFTTDSLPASADEQEASWARRMRASEVSADQKHRVFTTLGAHVDHLVLPDRVSRAEFIDHIETANADPTVAAIIVQTPPPPTLVGELDRIDPGKDIDALGLLSHRAAGATADGITRIARPFLTDHPSIAVVGGRGFVGSAVVDILTAQGHSPLVLDRDDDLLQVREVEVVIATAGQGALLTPRHLHAGHRLVVDSGFVPRPSGPVGDVDPDAARLPAAITPVPGGIGPVEMAVLAERLINSTAAPELPGWRFHGPSAGAELTTAQIDVRTERSATRDLGHDIPAVDQTRQWSSGPDSGLGAD
ncbi:MAG: hypothetical protein L0I24_14490 [Pseudonocardia sp.]|nr:hypothetical protein [Pseudonocardia sp.]